MNTRRFVLIDRDGTLIVERNYLADPAGVELIPGAASGLRTLAEAGFGLVLVTNQSGIARGYFDHDTLARIHERLSVVLAEHNVTLDGIYYCPHAPDDDCACRKPRTLMVERAAADHGFDPRNAFMIGDNIVDVGLGRNVGATTILVATGYGARVKRDGLAVPDYHVSDFGAAADLIVQITGQPQTVA